MRKSVPPAVVIVNGIVMGVLITAIVVVLTHPIRTNAETPEHHRCVVQATQQQLSTDLCEGLPHANWKGWQRLTAQEIRDTFPPGEHHAQCYYWADKPTGATVCTDGSVMSS